MDLRALLSMEAFVVDHEANGAADALADRVSFSVFSSVVIKKWQACLMSEHTAATDHVTKLGQSALSQEPENVCPDMSLPRHCLLP